MRNVRRIQCQTRDAKVNGLMPLLKEGRERLGACGGSACLRKFLHLVTVRKEWSNYRRLRHPKMGAGFQDCADNVFS